MLVHKSSQPIELALTQAFMNRCSKPHCFLECWACLKAMLTLAPICPT